MGVLGNLPADSSRQDFEESYGERSGAVHLTLISMMQAMALESIVSRVWALIAAGNVENVAMWCQAIGLVMTVFFIWFAYTTLLMSFQWRLSMLDVMFPFGAGITQFIEAGLMGSDAVGTFLAVGAAGYLVGGWTIVNTVSRILEETNHLPAIDALRSAPLRRVLTLVVAFIVVLVAGATAVSTGWMDSDHAWLAILPADVLLLMLVAAWASVWRRIDGAGAQS